MVVEDQAIVRQGIKLMIEHHSECIVVAEAENGQEALSALQRHIIDLVLLDIRMPVMNGIEAVKRMRERYPNLKILMLTTFNDEEYIIEALQNGANGYLLKEADPEAMIQAVQSCLQGNFILERDVANKLLPQLLQTKKPQEPERELPLTEREAMIAHLVAEGKSNNEIAKQVHLSVGTVKNNISHILDKLALRDRTQLAIFILKNEGL